MSELAEIFRKLATRFHVSGEKTVSGASAIISRLFVHTEVGMIYSNTTKGICVYYLERPKILECLVGTEQDFWDDMEEWHVKP